MPGLTPPPSPFRRESAAPNQRVELAGFQHGGAVEAAEMGPVGGLLGVQPPRLGGQQQFADMIMHDTRADEGGALVQMGGACC